MGKLTGKTALIIDDNSSAIRVLEQLLIRESMTSLSIQDTHNISKHLANASVPDVIFLDLEMPFTNGYAVLETIKSDARFKSVPVIAYTTHISHLNDAKRAGFDGFLGKPVDGRTFGALVERILNGEKVWEVPN